MCTDGQMCTDIIQIFPQTQNGSTAKARIKCERLAKMEGKEIPEEMGSPIQSFKGNMTFA